MVHLLAHRGRRGALVAVSLLLPLVVCSAPLSAQPAPPPAPVDLAELQRLGSLSEGQQGQAANQARLRLWFRHNIEVYRHAAEGSAVGRTPALVDPGPQAYPDFQGHWREIWANAGWHNVLWTNTKNPGVTDNDLLPHWFSPPKIEFGLQGKSVSANGGLPNTCWHEALHAILGQYTLSELNLNAFLAVKNSGKDDEQEIREHDYINWAERTIDWIAALDAFERLARVAAAEQQRYLANGVDVSLNWDIQHFLWRDAWLRWNALQTIHYGSPQAGVEKIAAAMTTGLCDQFVAYTGIRLPLRTEIVRFYMTGGLTDDPTPHNAGTPILVPEWVMLPDYRRARLIQLATTPSLPTCTVVPAGAGRAARCAFTVELTDTYRVGSAAKVVRPGVARGVLRVGLQGDQDPDARVEVRLKGKDFGAVARRVGGAVEIDLPALYRTWAAGPFAPGTPILSRPLALEVEFVRGKVEQLNADKRYALSLLYRDADDPAQGPAVYYDAEAVIFISIHPPPGTPAKPPAANPTTPPTPAVPAATGRGWYLVKTLRLDDGPHPPYPYFAYARADGDNEASGKWSDGRDYECTDSDNAYSYTCRAWFKPERGAAWEKATTRSYTWASPPLFMSAKSTWTAQSVISGTGTYVPPSGVAGVPFEGVAEGIGYYYAFRTKPCTLDDWSGEGAAYTSVTVRGIGSHAAAIPIPEYNPTKPILVMSVGASSFYGGHYSVWQYEWRDGPAAPPVVAAPPGEITTKVERKEAPPEDEDEKKKKKEIDNVPPPPPPPTPPPPPPVRRRPAGVWYTHPTGDWRMWLQKGMQVARGTGDFDDLSTPANGLRLRIWRGFETVPAAAQALAAKQAQLLARSPGATATEVTLGVAPGIVIEHPMAAGEQRWEYWFALGQRLYRADFVRSATATLAVPPLPGTSLLGTIERLRGGAGPGPAPAGGTQITIPDQPGKVNVLLCTDAQDMTAFNPGREFGQISRLAILLAYRDLPPGAATVVWRQDGAEVYRHEAQLGGTGASRFGIKTAAAAGLAPGHYEVEITMGGKTLVREAGVVRGAGPAPAPPSSLGQPQSLTKPSSSVSLGSDYPAGGMTLDLLLNYSQPGTVLDTVGILGAKVGSWAFQILPDGRLEILVFDPGAASAVRTPSGWHRLATTAVLTPNQPHLVRLKLGGGTLEIGADGAPLGRANLATRLSGQTVYLGDFPGDGPEVRGMVGTVTVVSLGP